jgi:hypothetical protein
MNADENQRRWYQFSLREMFVLTFVVSIPLAWVGYSLNWIRQRHDAMGPLRRLNALQIQSPDLFGHPEAKPTTAIAPCCLWLFGEQGQGELHVHDYPNGTSPKKLRKLFPEAKIVE